MHLTVGLIDGMGVFSKKKRSRERARELKMLFETVEE